jgi:hypothetical protein
MAQVLHSVTLSGEMRDSNAIHRLLENSGSVELPLTNPTRSSRGRFAPWCNEPSVERAARYAPAASPSDAGWFAGWGFKPTSALITSSGRSSSNHPITFWTHSKLSSLCLLS